MNRVALSFLAMILTAAPVQAGIFFYDDVNSFHLENQLDGKVPKGTEDFEESNVPQGGKAPLAGPLCPLVPQVDPNGIGFPTGLAQNNLCIYDNVTPGPAPAALNPSGLPRSLYVVGPGFIGANSKKVGEDVFLYGIQASIDLVFDPLDLKTGVGFHLSRYDGWGSAGWTISVFDVNNVLVGMHNVPAPILNEPAKSFFGVWSSDPIGRINIWDPIIAPEGIDNIEMWVPEPMTLGYLALGATLALRRRVRSS